MAADKPPPPAGRIADDRASGPAGSRRTLRRHSSGERRFFCKTDAFPGANSTDRQAPCQFFSDDEFISIPRPLKCRAALSISCAGEAGFLAVIRELPV
jgi:hypothetical protein